MPNSPFNGKAVKLISSIALGCFVIASLPTQLLASGHQSVKVSETCLQRPLVTNGQKKIEKISVKLDGKLELMAPEALVGMLKYDYVKNGRTQDAIKIILSCNKEDAVLILSLWAKNVEADRSFAVEALKAALSTDKNQIALEFISGVSDIDLKFFYILQVQSQLLPDMWEPIVGPLSTADVISLRSKLDPLNQYGLIAALPTSEIATVLNLLYGDDPLEIEFAIDFLATEINNMNKSLKIREVSAGLEQIISDLRADLLSDILKEIIFSKYNNTTTSRRQLIMWILPGCINILNDHELFAIFDFVSDIDYKFMGQTRELFSLRDIEELISGLPDYKLVLLLGNMQPRGAIRIISALANADKQRTARIAPMLDDKIVKNVFVESAHYHLRSIPNPQEFISVFLVLLDEQVATALNSIDPEDSALIMRELASSDAVRAKRVAGKMGVPFLDRYEYAGKIDDIKIANVNRILSTIKQSPPTAPRDERHTRDIFTNNNIFNNKLAAMFILMVVGFDIGIDRDTSKVILSKSEAESMAKYIHHIGPDVLGQVADGDNVTLENILSNLNVEPDLISQIEEDIKKFVLFKEERLRPKFIGQEQNINPYLILNFDETDLRRITYKEPIVSPSLVIGQELGRGKYKVMRLIGEGGMGVVYEVIDRKGNSRCLKMLKAVDPSQDDPYEVEEFFDKEARAYELMNGNEGLPNIYDHEVIPFGQGRINYMVMDLIKGRPLSDLVQEGRLDAKSLIGYILEAARILKSVHNKGLIHRDLGPDNIMIGDDAEVSIIDLGLVRPLKQPFLDTAMHPRGKEGLVSLEQITHFSQVKETADIHTLGADLASLLPYILANTEPIEPDLLANLKIVLERARGIAGQTQYSNIDELIAELNEVYAFLPTQRQFAAPLTYQAQAAVATNIIIEGNN